MNKNNCSQRPNSFLTFLIKSNHTELNEDYETKEELENEIKKIFNFLGAKIYISSHFFAERLQGREQRHRIENDVIEVLRNVVEKSKSYFESLKKNNNKKDVTIKSPSKKLTIMAHFDFKPGSDKYNTIRFITIKSGDPKQFNVGQQFVKVLMVEEETPKQPKVKQKINHEEQRKAQLKFLQDLLKKVQYEE